MKPVGLTKACAMGPIVDAVEQAGGSVKRVFGRAEMPIGLTDEPERLILLRDQLRLVECAARELGDAALPARLSTASGLSGLGAIGRHVCSSPNLEEAIRTAEKVTPHLLQTATWTGLRIRGGSAVYGYMVEERIDSGRQINEVLALGYLLGVVRHFLGADWRPDRAFVTGAVLPAKAEIEAVFGCELALGPQAGVSFSSDLLNTPNPAPVSLLEGEPARHLPVSDDLPSCIEQLVLLGLGRGRPMVDWVSQRLGMSRRTLQRRLEERQTTFVEIQRSVLVGEAKRLLAERQRSIGQIAHDLGYADPAHFSRAFVEWTGVTPRAFRRLQPIPTVEQI